MRWLPGDTNISQYLHGGETLQTRRWRRSISGITAASPEVMRRLSAFHAASSSIFSRNSADCICANLLNQPSIAFHPASNCISADSARAASSAHCVAKPSKHEEAPAVKPLHAVEAVTFPTEHVFRPVQRRQR
ncbi:hypothetical protein KCP78_24440 [Salmonella enterica subsp. enterica]|nr:hypothetical protein KCP78_24440 [Salmonella enterica subsp. enterica]